jgi:DNA-binding CsgD family transcriptional regulator
MSLLHAHDLDSQRYRGNEPTDHDPHARTAALASFPQAMLDELDYGILLLAPDQHLMLMNRAARVDLDEHHPLLLQSRQLVARWVHDAQALREALDASTRRGLRRLLTLGSDAHRVSVAVVPLGADDAAQPRATMVTLGKRSMCERLSVQWFARDHGLTLAETRVLEWLCAGYTPREIADNARVGLATVRTQLSSVRVKTSTTSLRDLQFQVSRLPPMMDCLRSPH